MTPSREAPGQPRPHAAEAGALRCGAQRAGTCVLPDALEEQWVLGQTLHLRGDHILQLQAAAPGAALSLLRAECAEWPSWGHAAGTVTPARLPPPPDPGLPLTCTKAQNRGSLRCLALSCSKANDWRLQKREEIFWNHLPSAPSNYSEIQAREGVSGGIGKSRASRGKSSLDRRLQ